MCNLLAQKLKCRHRRRVSTCTRFKRANRLTMRKGLDTKTTLRCQAYDEAYRMTWRDIYRHKMRYQARELKEELDLDDLDVKEITQYYRQLEDNEYPIKLITVNLPINVDLDKAKDALYRCLKKCYVEEWAYAFELGESEDHPHYHVIIRSAVKQLDKSRIIREWSKIFEIAPRYINVKSTSGGVQHRNLTSYVQKEDIVYVTSQQERPTVSARPRKPVK